MRILVVADIHGNSPALQAIQERCDLCLCMGDLVDYGPDPCSTVAWARQNATYIVRGNHDHGVAQGVAVSGEHGYRYLARTTREWTRQVLPEPDRQYLAQLPLYRYVTVAGKRFFLVHAVPQDPLDSYLMPNSPAWARQIADVEADYVCVGHTHFPFVLPIGNKTVINPGSVGQPRDGKPQAAYALIEDGRIELKRADYRVEQTIGQIGAIEIPTRAKQLAGEVLRSGGSCLRWNPGKARPPAGVE